MNQKLTTAIIISLLVLVGSAIFLLNRPEPTSLDNLEIFLSTNNASEEVKEAYRFARENPQEVLSKVKCYCGCLEQDHKNNRDCFFNDDGSFDLMGLNCGLCVKTALTSKKMLEEGKTVQEISDYIDGRWGKAD